MQVKFHTLGMSFVAEVNFIEGSPGSDYAPPEPDEVEILWLMADGRDATFLMDSTLSEEIEAEALAAARAEIQEIEAEVLAAARAEIQEIEAEKIYWARREDEMCCSY